MSCRLDKYLWAVRLSKTRSQAADLVSRNKVKINDALVKPSKEVKVNDVIAIQHNTATFSYKVLNLLEKRVGAKLVPEYMIDITPAEEIEKFKAYQLAQSTYRNYGTGKPSKKDRRELGDFLDF